MTNSDQEINVVRHGVISVYVGNVIVRLGPLSFRQEYIDMC